METYGVCVGQLVGLSGLAFLVWLFARSLGGTVEELVEAVLDAAGEE